MAEPDAPLAETDAPRLDFHGLAPPDPPDLDLWAMFARARAETGRRWWRILADFLPLQRFPNRLLLVEYFGYRLYEWERLDAEARGRFVGFLGQRAINRRLNRGARPPGLWGDKLLFDALMRGAGLPTPPIQAVFRPISGAAPSAPFPLLTDADALAAFLRRDARYPLFGKPVRGEQSRGVASLEAFDPAADRLRFVDGPRPTVSAFAEMVAAEAGFDGYLLQDRLAPHPDIAEVSAGGLNTVRFVTACVGGAPEILYAVWKVAAPGAPTDDGLYPGALKVAIDADTGETVRAQQGAWIGHRALSAHPVTAAPLLGRRLPDWGEARRLALCAAALTPRFRILGWDVALTPDGPVLVEGNGDPGHRVFQTAAGRGVLTDRFRAVIDAAEVEERARRRDEAALIRRRRAAFRAGLWRKLRRDLLRIGG